MVPFDPLALINRHGLATASDLVAEPLTGGYLNQVFRVRGSGVDWVVKGFMPETELVLFPNLPQAEHQALTLASAIDAAPRPVTFLEEQGMPVLIYEYCEGMMWRTGVEDVARLLRRLRALNGDGFRDVAMTPEAILAEGEAFLPALTPAMRAKLMAVQPKPIEIDAVPRSFLHTDIGPGNIIVTPEGRLVVIDWQCPAAGDAVQDAIAFLSPAFQILYGCPPLKPEQEAAFFAAYDDAALKARYDRMRPFYDWRMAGYCATRMVKYAATRPAASENYARALAALMERLT